VPRLLFARLHYSLFTRIISITVSAALHVTDESYKFCLYTTVDLLIISRLIVVRCLEYVLPLSNAGFRIISRCISASDPI